jgi:hypothetical protein
VDRRLQELDIWQQEESSTRGKKPQSGRNEKVDSGVVRAVVWPHTRLEARFCAGNSTFDSIDFALLVAGEAAIIADSSIPTEEAYARLKLLKFCAYYSKSYDWGTVRDLYGAALVAIERGTAWRDLNYSELAATVLFLPSRPSGTSRNAYGRDRNAPTFFCSAFNRGSCQHNGGHLGRVNGKDRWLDHICAACFLANKEVKKHSENSNSCPRRNRRRGSRGSRGSTRGSNNPERRRGSNN